MYKQKPKTYRYFNSQSEQAATTTYGISCKTANKLRKQSSRFKNSLKKKKTYAFVLPEFKKVNRRNNKLRQRLRKYELHFELLKKQKGKTFSMLKA